MTKKTFGDVAKQFLSTPEEEDAQEEAQKNETKTENPKELTVNVLVSKEPTKEQVVKVPIRKGIAPQYEEIKPQQKRMVISDKKYLHPSDFPRVAVRMEEPPKDKPTRPKAAQKPPAGYKLDPNMVETKTKRVQLVLQPSLYERAREKAWREHLSVNEYIHQLIEKDTGSGEL